MRADPTGASSLALIVLAAGAGQRFGGPDKLAVPLAGRPVVHHVLATLDPLPWHRRVLIHRGEPAWCRAFADAGFTLVRNDQPERGMLGSLHLAAQAVQGTERALLCLADMPLITSAHIQALLAANRGATGQVVASRAGDYRGPPAILPLAAVRTLPPQGEGGARALLARAAWVDCDPDCVRDVDTPADLLSIQESCL